MPVYLTPVAMGYLTQIILVLLISAYLILQLRHGSWTPHLLWLIGAFVAIGAFIITMFLEAAFLPTPRLLVVFWQNSMLGIATFCLIQFAYRFPQLQPGLRREAQLAGLFSLLYTLAEVGFAIYRVRQLAVGNVWFRPPWLDYFTAVNLLWVAVGFYRQLIFLSVAAVAGRPSRWHTVWLAPLIWPPQEARAARNFVFIFAFVTVLGLFNILQGFYLVSVAMRNVVVAIGILFSLLAFGLTYIVYRPETTSFVIRLGGVVLTLVLAILGTAGWLIAPVYEAEYEPALPHQQSIAFTPDGIDGYVVTEMAYYFEEDWGQFLLQVVDDVMGMGPCQVSLPFAFPFYGRLYQQIYVCDDGLLGLGAPVSLSSHQYRYGHGVPLLAPMLMDFYPQISAGGVYARQEAERLIITWQRLRGYVRPELEMTFQAVLFSDGRFHFNYAELPTQITYRANDRPEAVPWFMGVLSGGRENWREPDLLDLHNLPQRIGANGGVQDYLQAFRAYLHRLLSPLVRLSVASSLFILIAFPVLLNLTLAHPLSNLLTGFQQVAQGNYNLNMPIYFNDEIGFLTQTANQLSQQLGDLVQHLETRVAERTRELNAARLVAEEQSQRAEAAAQAKTAFLAHMSHELRTPLNAILGFSELMSKDSNITPQQRSHLNVINRSGEHLLALINDVLDFSKIDAARVIVNATPFSLHSLLQDLIPMFSLRAKQKGLTLTAVFAPELPEYIVADQGKLRQILINLLGNAIKFTPAGKVSLHVHLANGQTAVRFIVQDTGIGIAPEDLERIFDPFVQTHSLPQAQEGTGLGLAISLEFARLMGGELRVSSILAQGSTFTLDLPLRLPEGDAHRPPQTAVAQVVGLAANQPVYRLLVVDDAPTTRQLLLELLQPLGFAIRTAENGRQAIEAWQEWQPDLIFMDINMPELDGFAATRQIRAEAPTSGMPVIIAMTANVSPGDRQAAWQAGCNDFLPKPFPLPTVLSLLAEYLGVEYLYSQGQMETAVALPDAPNLDAQLATLPTTWLAELATAAQSGDVNWLNQLMDQLTERETAVGAYLTDLANKFDHQTLYNLATTTLNQINQTTNENGAPPSDHE